LLLGGFAPEPAPFLRLWFLRRGRARWCFLGGRLFAFCFVALCFFLRLRFGLFTFRFLFFGRFFLDYLGRVDPLEQGHCGGIALALTEPNDAGVTAIGLGRGGGGFGGRFFGGLFMGQVGQGVARGTAGAGFSERGHAVGERAWAV